VLAASQSGGEAAAAATEAAEGGVTGEAPAPRPKKGRRRDLDLLAEQLQEVECLEVVHPRGSYDELRELARAAQHDPSAAASLQPLPLSVVLDCEGCTPLLQLELPEGYPLKRGVELRCVSCPTIDAAPMASLHSALRTWLDGQERGVEALVAVCEEARRLVRDLHGPATACNDRSSPVASPPPAPCAAPRPAAAGASRGTGDGRWGAQLPRNIVCNHSTHLDGLLPALVRLSEASRRHGLVLAKLVPAQLKPFRGGSS